MNGTLPLTDKEVGAAAIMMACVGGISLCVTSAVIYALLKINPRNPYHLICVSTGVGDSIMLCIFGIFCPYVALVGDVDTALGRVGANMGALGNVGWNISCFSITLCSVNRFFGVTAGPKYRIWFSTKRTFMYLALGWIFAIGAAVPYLVTGCEFVFNPQMFLWGWLPTPCNVVLAYFNWYSILSMIILISVMNCLTLIKLRQFRKKKSNISDNAARKRQEEDLKRERSFFKQAFINAIVLEVLEISFYYIGFYAKTTLQLFLGTSFLWICAHASNGYILIVFHKQVRDFLFGTSIKFESTATIATKSNVAQSAWK